MLLLGFIFAVWPAFGWDTPAEHRTGVIQEGGGIRRFKQPPHSGIREVPFTPAILIQQLCLRDGRPSPALLFAKRARRERGCGPFVSAASGQGR